MLIEVKVPQLSESVAEATLSVWHVKEGDAVGRDQNLIDIETDKVVLELPAPAAGVIVKIIKTNGATVVAGEVIAHLDTEATASTSAVKATPEIPVVAQASAAPVAMPAARKIMEEKGLAAAEVQGSGRGGRILKEDVSGAPKAAVTVQLPQVLLPSRQRRLFRYSLPCLSPPQLIRMRLLRIALSNVCRCRAYVCGWLSDCFSRKPRMPF
jgi:2-oxoglutarate dehydrogenase E2 component (dihydrolipoamide succinyltransferase)